MNKPAEAAAAVAAVPSTFSYSIQHDENTGRQNNAIFSFNYLEGRFAVGDREGTNGLPFVSLNDPRVPIVDCRRRLRRRNRAVPHDEVLRSLVAHSARRGKRSPAHSGRGGPARG